jgi:hypothetical protein
MGLQMVAGRSQLLDGERPRIGVDPVGLFEVPFAVAAQSPHFAELFRGNRLVLSAQLLGAARMLDGPLSVEIPAVQLRECPVRIRMRRRQLNGPTELVHGIQEPLQLPQHHPTAIVGICAALIGLTDSQCSIEVGQSGVVPTDMGVCRSANGQHVSDGLLHQCQRSSALAHGVFPSLSTNALLPV